MFIFVHFSAFSETILIFSLTNPCFITQVGDASRYFPGIYPTLESSGGIGWPISNAGSSNIVALQEKDGKNEEEEQHQRIRSEPTSAGYVTLPSTLPSTPPSSLPKTLPKTVQKSVKVATLDENEERVKVQQIGIQYGENVENGENEENEEKPENPENSENPETEEKEENLKNLKKGLNNEKSTGEEPRQHQNPSLNCTELKTVRNSKVRRGQGSNSSSNSSGGGGGVWKEAGGRSLVCSTDEKIGNNIRIGEKRRAVAPPVNVGATNNNNTQFSARSTSNIYQGNSAVAGCGNGSLSTTGPSQFENRASATAVLTSTRVRSLINSVLTDESDCKYWKSVFSNIDS